jgi:hypothetical protein
MASLTATANPATGSVLINLDRTLVRDAFNRVVVNGWGTASTAGGAYTLVGGAAADYDVDGNFGLQDSIVGTFHSGQISNSGSITADARFIIPVTPSGAATDVGILTRGSGGDFYLFRVRINPGGPVTAQIFLRVGGVLTPLSEAVDIDFFITGTNNIGITIQDSGTRLQMKAWRSLLAEPVAWTIDVPDPVGRGGAAVGLYSLSNTGNTNGAFTYQFDNFRALVGVAPLNLYRVTPDGTETLVRGSGFTTQYPEGVAVIWDNEAPFDVNVFYVLRSSNNPNLNVLTSNTVNLSSGGDVWLRDPYNPSNNIVIEISDDQFDYCNEIPRIMFSDLVGRVYSNASGVFDIIDAQRPQTVAQTRKRYASTLILTSKEAADVESIETIIAGGYPLLLSLPPVYQFGLPYGTDWVAILDVDASPVGVDRRVPTRVWTLPFRLSEVPADIEAGNTNGNGVGGGDATYDILAASVIGTTYTSLAATALTYNDIAAGTGY